MALFGGSGKTHRRAYKRFRGEAFQELDSMQALLSSLFGSARGEMGKGMEELGEAYKGARSNVSRTMGGARTDAMSQLRNAQGGLSQQMTSRGLSGSTAGANLGRGLLSDSQRQMESIAGVESSMLGRLSEAEGKAKASQRNAIGSTYMSQFAGRQGVGSERLALLKALMGGEAIAGQKQDSWGQLLGAGVKIAGAHAGAGGFM